jgi:hypothetical protein
LDKDIKFFSESETRQYMASRTFEAKLVYWAQDGNKQALASCRTQALGHCNLSESKAKPLSADEERKVRDYMMQHTPFKGPPQAHNPWLASVRDGKGHPEAGPAAKHSGGLVEGFPGRVRSYILKQCIS